MTDKVAAPDDRLHTGVPGVDTLLGGGFIRGGVYLVMGKPGTGKTTFGNQLCFAAAGRGERAVYVTLLAETHARMLRNVQPFGFFRPEFIGNSLNYLGGYLVLRERRLTGLLQLIRQVLHDERPSVLVLDGITSAHGLGESDVSLKEFVAELQVMVDMSGCTGILLANMTSADANSAEHSMVDGLLELTLHRTDQRTFRELEVLKFRGSDHYLGCHDMEIAAPGMIVRPRTELVFAKNSRPAPPTRNRRADFGLPNLDGMLGGGLLAGTTTMLLGFAGSGKTLLAMHFLEAGAKRGEQGLYFGFYESPERLLEAADHVNLPLRSHVEAGTVAVHWQPPLKFGLDALAEHLLGYVDEHQVKRVVIDGLDGIRQSTTRPERPIRFITALVNELRARDVTLIITEETQKLFGPEIEVRIEGMSALVESIVLLEYRDVGSDLRRLISIVKQRASGYETSVRELCITDQGVTLADDSVSADAILEGRLVHTQGKRKRASPTRSDGGRGRTRGRRR